jgi:hypothetical protein
MMGQQLIDPFSVIPDRGTVSGERNLYIHLSEPGKAM